MCLLCCLCLKPLIQFHSAEIGACSWSGPLANVLGFVQLEMTSCRTISTGVLRYNLLRLRIQRPVCQLSDQTTNRNLVCICSNVKAGHVKAVSEVRAARSSFSSLCVVQRTQSWEWLNTSDSPWTLYWSMDTPLSTERQRSSKAQRREAFSLCLYFLSVSLLLKHSLSHYSSVIPHWAKESMNLTCRLIFFSWNKAVFSPYQNLNIKIK